MKFKMAAAANLNLLPVAILINCRLSTIDLNGSTKFRTNISIHDWIVITFEIQDGGRPPSWNCCIII